MSLSSECPASLKTLDRNSLIQIIRELTTRIHNLEEENQELKNLIQNLKDEIHRLKGEKGRPVIKSSLPDNPPTEKKQRRSRKWKKSRKTITITRGEHLPINKELLPEDARYKGTRRIVIQDLRIEPDNIEFELERYYSAWERKTYESRLPQGYEGSSFGPGIRHLVLALHYQGRMPQKLLQTFFLGMGVRISEGEVAFLLVTSAARFQAEHEAATITTFRSSDHTKRLGCDDANQFKGLIDDLQLCWVHVTRHFKTLDLLTPEFRHTLDRFLDSLWTYYEKLNHYKQAPCSKDKVRLWRELDNVFKPETGYYALDRRIKKVLQQKAELLTVLSFPQIPLHNNPCELDVREKVVQRKIRNCHRSAAGASASDLFLGLIGTCRKNKISYWEFLKDRIYKTHTILELQKIIASSPPRASPTATSY